MAAKREQIPAPAAAATPVDATELAPNPPADGDVPHKTAVVGACAGSGDGGGGELGGCSPGPVALRRDVGLDKGDGKPGEERGEQEAEDLDRGGGKRKGALFLPDAKRKKACPAALEQPHAPPAADRMEEAPSSAGDGRDGVAPGGGGGGESSSLSFSFSFATKGFSGIETTPKFGSFNFAALAAEGGEPELVGTAAAAGGGGDEPRSQEGEGEL